MKELHEKLLAIQSELKAPKNMENKFSGYKYRSAEGILEAAKPVLKKNKCAVLLSDEVELIGERFYIKAKAILVDAESDQSLSVTAYAREAESKKGNDVAQVTGATSSYARKYALNGLFCIDDTKTDEIIDIDSASAAKNRSAKDNDSKGEKVATTKKEMVELIDEVQSHDDFFPTADEVRAELEKRGIYETFVCKVFQVESIDAMDDQQRLVLSRKYDKMLEKQNKGGN